MDYILKPDMAFAGQMGTIVPALVAAPLDFGLTPDDVATLAALRTGFNNKLAAAEAAKAALATAIAEKDAARSALEAVLRPLIQRVQSAPGVNDETRRAAGIPVRDKIRSTIAPVAVIGLVATLDGANAAVLAWNSNGNASGIQYRIEKKLGGAGEWQLVDAVNPTRLRVTGLTPGQRVDFRVIARRGAATAESSNVASVYAG
jgi:hypothetical protein